MLVYISYYSIAVRILQMKQWTMNQVLWNHWQQQRFVIAHTIHCKNIGVVDTPLGVLYQPFLQSSLHNVLLTLIGVIQHLYQCIIAPPQHNKHHNNASDLARYRVYRASDINIKCLKIIQQCNITIKYINTCTSTTCLAIK